MNQISATMQAIKIKTIGQSAAKSIPTRAAVKTNPRPAPDPAYLQHPTQGASKEPNISPRHIVIIYDENFKRIIIFRKKKNALITVFIKPTLIHYPLCLQTK
jgi:hypothetical protein